MNNKVGFSGNGGFFQSLGTFVDKGFYIGCSTFGTIIMSISSIYAGSYDFIGAWKSHNYQSLIASPVFFLIIGCLLFIFGSYGTYKDSDRLLKKIKLVEEENQDIVSLKTQINEAEEYIQSLRGERLLLHKRLAQEWLIGVSKHANLGTNSRVTIYYEDNEEFYLLERYSKNPTYSKIHRQKFPLNHGAISLAWQHGEYIDINCPSFDENNHEYYKHISKTYGYEQDKVEKLTMKSCIFFGLAISDADRNIGVILFECDKKGSLDEDQTEKIRNYCSHDHSHLCRFVRDATSYDQSTFTNSRKTTIKNQSAEDEVLAKLGAKHE